MRWNVVDAGERGSLVGDNHTHQGARLDLPTTSAQPYRFRGATRRLRIVAPERPPTLERREPRLIY